VKRGRKPRRGRSFALFLALVLLAYGFYGLERAIMPTLKAISEVKVTNLALQVMASTVEAELADAFRYQDLMEIDRDSTGRIMLIRPNRLALVRAQSRSLKAIQEAVKRLEDVSVSIPLGQAMGSTILANMGPRIPVHIVPMGMTQVHIRDRFDSAGINTVRHLIYMEADVDVKVLIPLITTHVNVQLEAPICEAIIPGEVPSTYVRIGF
jgi:sporulation protein YunB